MWFKDGKRCWKCGCTHTEDRYTLKCPSIICQEMNLTVWHKSNQESCTQSVFFPESCIWTGPTDLKVILKVVKKGCHLSEMQIRDRGTERNKGYYNFKKIWFHHILNEMFNWLWIVSHFFLPLGFISPLFSTLMQSIFVFFNCQIKDKSVFHRVGGNPKGIFKNVKKPIATLPIFGHPLQYFTKKLFFSLELRRI